MTTIIYQPLHQNSESDLENKIKFVGKRMEEDKFSAAGDGKCDVSTRTIHFLCQKVDFITTGIMGILVISVT